MVKVLGFTLIALEKNGSSAINPLCSCSIERWASYGRKLTVRIVKFLFYKGKFLLFLLCLGIKY